MLYGYSESLDNRVATIVSAADTVSEYDGWVAALIGEDPREHHVEAAASILTDHLFRSEFKGYKRPVLLVYHTDVWQQDKFVDKWRISIVKPVNARDRQADMLWNEQQIKQAEAWEKEVAAAQAEDREVTGETLEEIHGLTENDPWDKRSPEMKAQDAALREQLKEMQKKGAISGDDSFGDANTQRGATEKSSDVTVTDIRGKQAADGRIEIDSAIAHKAGGGVEREKQEEQPTRRYNFTPEDFAAVLAGDGSADHLNIPADKSADKKRREPGSRDLNLSAGAEEARKEYQAQQQKLKEAQDAERRAEEEEADKKDHENGIFRGCDLWPDQTIARSDLPETVRKLLDQNDIITDPVPLKVYPLSSQLGDKVLLPSDSLGEERPLYVAATENLTVEGTIQVGNPKVLIAKKARTDERAWVVYAQPKKHAADDAKDRFDVSVVLVR